jgi:hypothetical protein
MAAEQAEGFADNWVYLRTELHWLERLLMSAVAKQQKDVKEIERVARSKADRATSHWWKGIINAEGSIAYDEYRKPAGKVTHQQQLEAQIQVARQQGVALALPNLRDRLSLSPFEKNVVLMSLAPEVNHRYGQLYRYLQGDTATSDLPTLDLALRIFCKTDQEWRTARNHLISKSRLTRYRLLRLLPTPDNITLNAPLQLTERLVNYLLCDQPTPQALDEVLKACMTPAPLLASSTALTATSNAATLRPRTESAGASLLQQSLTRQTWADLVLPEATLTALQGLAQQLQGYPKAIQQWGLAAELETPGLIALLTGNRFRSQRLAARAIATMLEVPLLSLDLATIDPVDYGQALAEMTATAPTVLLIQSAELWLKRSTLLSGSLLQQFLAQRQAQPAITLLTVAQPAAIQPCWRSVLAHPIEFPPLNPTDRSLLWQKAFPAQVPLDPKIDWQTLAAKLPLQEAEIYAIAQATLALAAQEAAAAIEAQHLVQVLVQHGQPIELQSLVRKSAKRRSKRSNGEA